MKQGHEDTMIGSHPGGRVTASSVRCSIFEYLMIACPRNSEVFGNHGLAFREHQPCHFWSSTIGSVTYGVLELLFIPILSHIAYPEDLFLNSLRVVALSHQQWSGFDCTMIQRQKRRIAKVLTCFVLQSIGYLISLVLRLLVRDSYRVKNSKKSKKMNTIPGYSSLPGEELNLEDMSPMAILDGMELGTLASLAPVTKTIEAENVKVVGVDQIDQVSEASRSKKKKKGKSSKISRADHAAEQEDYFDGSQSLGDRIDQAEILETNRESPAKERQKTKKRTVEKRQKKFAENRVRELVGMDKMITSKSRSSLCRLRSFVTPFFIYIIFVRYKK
ncbi:hypothetical protein F2Q70_00043522 [Brassica cretica]|uniref:Uncharacterized protein n=1 Tax=Brassica cretica TaxID=69181 RepID=A0A8S9KHL0_BRACR|nr:hypothetical protein F2Q70_00043522 [Brassica cretica]